LIQTRAVIIRKGDALFDTLLASDGLE